MPRGDKSSYTGKQKRQAEHIEEGYEHRGVGRKEAERRAWATVNKETGGGKASAGRPAAARSRSAKKRQRNASETPRRGRERAKPRGSDSPQATSAAVSAAGATKSAPHCAFRSPTISALGRARLNRNPCPS
jgi:plasmid stabilization system protein ParE